MSSVVDATKNDALLVSDIATRSFIESHGHSAPAADIAFYVSQHYSPAIFESELLNTKNNYNIIYHNGIAAGYSNIIFNSPCPNCDTGPVAKLDRIYLLQEFYGLQLGHELFEYNINLAKQQHQKGIWLYTWKENERAIKFYIKMGFIITGSHDFKISATHSNPNHLMLRLFQ